MESRSPHRKTLRSLAVTGCVLASLATPTLAGATQPKPDIAPSTGAHYEGSVLVGGNQSAKPAAPAISGAHYEGSVLVGGNQSAKVSTPAPSTSTKPAAPKLVVHELQTTDTSDNTLAIVLASSALGLALCGSAFAVIRVTRMQRRVLSSN
jgi:hypothetical protein